jgi:hypothetical protein
MNIDRPMKQISVTALVLLLAQIHAPALVDTEPIPPVSGTLRSIVLGDKVTVVPGDAIAITPGDTLDLPDHSVQIVSSGSDKIVPEDSVYLDRVPTFSVTFHLAKKLVVVGPDGKVINPSTLQTWQIVTLHFMRDGNESIVDRIFLQ